MQNSFTLAYRRAGLYACSLLADGYVPRVEYKDNKAESAFFSLRHVRNRSTVSILVNRSGWAVKRDGRIVHEENVRI